MTASRVRGRLPGRPSGERLRAAVLTLSAVLIGSGLVANVDARVADRAQLPRQGRLSDCVLTGPRETVEDLNDFIALAPGVPGFLGADVGVDVRLDDGRSLWLFADTLRRSSGGPPLVHNSMLVFDRECAYLVEPAGGSGALVPDRADGVGYWPMSAWSTPDGVDETVHVMLQRVVRRSGEGFDFVTLGPAVAVFDVPHSGVPRFLYRQDLGPDDDSGEAPEWGAAAARDGRWLYLYGTSTRELPGIHGFALRVARVPVGQVAERARWRYWDGSTWQTDPALAAPLISEVGGVSQTLSVWAQEGRWWVLSKQDEFLGTHITVWPGAGPTGPFGPPTVVAELPCDAATGELRYMPLAHPGLLPEPGTVVVSYSRNYVDFDQVCAEPSHYRPYFLRVALPQ